MTYAKIINGKLREATEIKPDDMTDWVEVNIPMIELRYDGNNFYAEPYVEPVPIIESPIVPQVLTPRQARLALLQATLLDEVEAMLATNREMQIWWEYSLDIQRNHPHIIAMADAIGLTEQQLDELFVLGGGL